MSKAQELYELTLDGTCEDSGNVDAPCGWFALVEDHEDYDWIVRQDDQGFITCEGPFEYIDISREGYYQPARKRYEELEAEYSEWLGGDEDA